jgi:hypothetical protein
MMIETDQPTNQLTNWPTDQPANQPMNQPTNPKTVETLSAQHSTAQHSTAPTPLSPTRGQQIRKSIYFAQTSMMEKRLEENLSPFTLVHLPWVPCLPALPTCLDALPMPQAKEMGPRKEN